MRNCFFQNNHLKKISFNLNHLQLHFHLPAKQRAIGYYVLSVNELWYLTMDDTTRAKLNEMEKRFRQRLKQTAMEIAGWDEVDKFDDLISICHKLAGSSGTFGFAETSKHLKAFELKLKAIDAPTNQEEACDLYKEASQLIAKES